MPAPAPPATDRPVTPEVALLAGVTALHVVDHRVVPHRHHLSLHLAATAALVGAGRVLGLSWGELGLDSARLGRGLRRGVLGGSVIGGVILAAALPPRSRTLFLDRRAATLTRREALVRALVEIPFGTALYEEVLFRGVLLGLARRRLHDVPAALVTSGLFGLWHVLPALSSREANPATRDHTPVTTVAASVASTAIAGLFFTWDRLRTDSVVTPVLTHTATNAVSFAVAVEVARRASTDPPAGPDA